MANAVQNPAQNLEALDYPPEQEQRTTRFVFASILIMLCLNIPASINGWGWKSAFFNTALVMAVTIAFAIKTKDRRLMAWILLGVGAGFTELFADYWLVHHTKSLVYAPNEPMLAASPAYMPGAWALVVLQMGVVAHWLRKRMPAWSAGVVTALICGVNIPVYEHLAKGADWWYYTDTPMVFATPFYIIVGEMILGPPLVWMAGVFNRRPADKILGLGLALGVLEGAIIFGAYYVGWWLVGPCSGAVIQFSCN